MKKMRYRCGTGQNLPVPAQIPPEPVPDRSGTGITVGSYLGLPRKFGHMPYFVGQLLSPNQVLQYKYL